MLRARFAIPGDLDAPTGGYAYDRAVLAAAPAAGLWLEHVALPGGFPLPDAAALAEAGRILAAKGPPLIVDGLALGATPADLLDAVRAPIVALLHHPLALEAGLNETDATRLRATEGAALARAAVVVTTSHATVRVTRALWDVPEAKFLVAPPGLAGAQRAAGGGATPVIVSVGSLIPRKGHDVLIAALAALTDLDWRAAIYGADAYAPDWAARLRAQAAPLGARVTFHGAVDAGRLAAAYHGADVFCLPTRYEGYGMVFAEAMARGLPVVAADIDAAREVLPEAARILAPVDDADALAAALRRLLTDAPARRAMADAAFAHARALPGWDATAAVIREAVARATGEAP